MPKALERPDTVAMERPLPDVPTPPRSPGNIWAKDSRQGPGEFGMMER